MKELNNIIQNVNWKEVTLWGLFILGLYLIFPHLASAGAGGMEFQDIYDTISGWSSGVLGKVFAVGAFLTGMGFGIARQSLISCVTGIGAALAVQYFPAVVDNVVTAII